MDLEDRGQDPRLAGVLRLVDEASRPRPLAEVLAALCSEVSAILDADVVSLYLRERASADGSARGEELRMAANVGFPAGAVNRVRLRVGEGITGHVAESLRPAAVVLAPEDNRYKSFPELREERFPIFLAVPMLVGHRAEGVVVLQRRAKAFDDSDTVLAAALTMVFAYALERASSSRREVAASEEPRTARLEGAALSKGRAMGRVETLPTFEGLAALERSHEGDPADESTPELVQRRRARIEEAFSLLTKDLERIRKRFEGDASMRVELETLALLESDGVFRETLLDEVPTQNVALGLRKMARDYAQVPYKRRQGESQTADKWLTLRSTEVEEFCLLLASRLVGERIPANGSVLLVPDRLTAIMAQAAVAQRVAAIAICHSADASELGVRIARAAGIPVVADVGGLFAWARRGDIVLVDGDGGVVRVHPSAAQLAEFRDASKKREGA
jgi:phosphotransferase system enzyme I (PtsP)